MKNKEIEIDKDRSRDKDRNKDLDRSKEKNKNRGNEINKSSLLEKRSSLHPKAIAIHLLLPQVHQKAISHLLDKYNIINQFLVLS